MIDVVSTAAPGIDDLVVLGKIKQLERSSDWDTIIVDGPAAGHAVTMLTSAAGLRDAVSGGPVRAQADDVLAMLGDARRCQVALVTLAETTPVNETVATAFTIEDRVGVQAGAGVRQCRRWRRASTSRLPTTPAGIDEAVAALEVDGPTAAALTAAARSAPSAGRCKRVPSPSWPAPCPSTSCTSRSSPADWTERQLSRLVGDVRRGGTATMSGTGTTTLQAVLDDAAVVVCCGSGGVGKTTVAAAIGIEAARRGRRVVVLTIDPAKRLADALGVDELGAEPQRIDTDRSSARTAASCGR